MVINTGTGRTVSGAALVECALCLLLVIPLLAYTLQLGKLGELKLRVLAAGRYLAWESTVSSRVPDDLITHERFLDYPHRAFAHPPTETVPIDSSAFWRRHDSPAETMGAESVNTTMSMTTHPDAKLEILTAQGTVHSTALNLAADAQQTLIRIESAAEINHGHQDVDWPDGTQTITRSHVEVGILANPYLRPLHSNCAGVTEQRQFACMQGSTALLSGHWSAGSTTQSADRSRSFLPSIQWREMANNIARQKSLPFYADLTSLDGALGYVDATILPAGISTRKASKPDVSTPDARQ